MNADNPNKIHRSRLGAWKCSQFSQLSADEIYEVLRLRQDVFIVEQNCAYPDIDDYDKSALHCLGMSGETVASMQVYCRILPPGMRFEEASIGRVITRKECRYQGWGRELMAFALASTASLFPDQKVRISAQAHLQQFYSYFGFCAVSDVYLEDNIPHVEMLCK